MSISPKARAQLADQQAALVKAILAGDEPPPDFDAIRLGVAGASLAKKRARAATRAWPGLALDLGGRFRELFAAYAENATLPRQGGPLADGRAFASWLADRAELPDAGRLQAMAIDLRYTSSPDGLIPRRWPTCRAAWFWQPRRLIVAIWLPWLGEHWLTIQLGRRRHDKGVVA
jgi:hypothetical protein